VIAVRTSSRRRLRRVAGTRSGHLADRLAPRPVVTTVIVAVAAGAGTAVFGGPVAAVLGVAYAVVGVRTWLRVRHNRLRVAAWSTALDALAGLAGDLRAGLPPQRALPVTEADVAAVPLVDDRIRVALHVAEATGAPLADLVERLEVDLRGLDRVRRSAAAHAAGTRATAALLGVLPLAGIAVGYGMGADPLHVLLRTPIGAACALGALTLQLAGLAWTARLSRAPDGLT
jgi:tight adherence protein B